MLQLCTCSIRIFDKRLHSVPDKIDLTKRSKPKSSESEKHVVNMVEFV